MSRDHLWGILVTCAAVASSRALSSQDFALAPLSVPAILPNDSLPGTPRAFLEWLRAQTPSALTNREQQVREHVYALIAEIVKQRFNLAQAVDLPRGDTVLAQLFSWADRLGVPGAGKVAQAIDSQFAPTTTPEPGNGFQLLFSPPAFLLATEHGKWIVRFPYFFMIGTTTRQRLANGIENDIVTLSTLTAANSTPPGGASQATILLLSGQTADLPSYVAFWLQQLQMTSADTTSNLVPQATRSYRHFDPVSRLWKEVVALKIPSGSMVVAYIGLDGTYQSNRAHFLDILTSLRVRQ